MNSNTIRKTVLFLVFHFSLFAGIAYSTDSSTKKDSPESAVQKFLKALQSEDFISASKLLSPLDDVFIENQYPENDGTYDLAGYLETEWRKTDENIARKELFEEKISVLNSDISALSVEKKKAEPDEKDDINNLITLNESLKALFSASAFSSKSSFSGIAGVHRIRDKAVVAVSAGIKFRKEDAENVKKAIETILENRKSPADKKSLLKWTGETLVFPRLYYLQKDEKNTWKIMFFSSMHFPLEGFEEFINSYIFPFLEEI